MRDFNTRSAAVCPLCGSADSISLPEPAAQSMTSDWRVVATPLAKQSCAHCGLVFRDPQLPRPADFGQGYELYAHAPGAVAEQRRQAAYADWIAAAVVPPARVLDIGCGNGSLLLALRKHWPDAELMGCDPSPDSVHYARAAGLHAWTGDAQDLPVSAEADLVVTVNVIEHTIDPRAFIACLQKAVAPRGQVVLICPDGGHPSVELLIADHFFTFTGQHVASLLRDAGLTPQRWSVAPTALGAFQMVVASREAHDRVALPALDRTLLRTTQSDYLGAWARLDAELERRLGPGTVCFGAGEAAGLLRAYAPRSWAHVRACTTDEAVGGTFGELPRIPLPDVTPDATALVGVRPQDQERVAARLRSRFARVVTWYDLVPSDDSR